MNSDHSYYMNMSNLESIHHLSETSQILADPSEVKSHFTIVEQANRKGQARYRCIMCHHEFSCTGKLRLVQHIVGIEFAGSNFKNVKACPNPFMPLKQALLKKRMQDEENIVKVLTEMKDSSTMSISDSDTEAITNFRAQQSAPPCASIANMLENMKDCTLTRNSAAYLIATAAASLDSGEKVEEEEEGEEQRLDRKRPLSTVTTSSDAIAEAEEPSIAVDAVSSQVPLPLNTTASALKAPKRQAKKRKSEAKPENGTVLPNSSYINTMMNSLPKTSKELPFVTGDLTLERLLSIFHIIHQISPQVYEAAIVLQNIRENQLCHDFISSDENHPLPSHITSLLNPFGSKQLPTAFINSSGKNGLAAAVQLPPTTLPLPSLSRPDLYQIKQEK